MPSRKASRNGPWLLGEVVPRKPTRWTFVADWACAIIVRASSTPAAARNMVAAKPRLWIVLTGGSARGRARGRHAQDARLRGFRTALPSPAARVTARMLAQASRIAKPHVPQG